MEPWLCFSLDGMFKKLGNQPVQTKLGLAQRIPVAGTPKASLSTISLSEAKKIKFVNQDDFDKDFPPEKKAKK